MGENTAPKLIPVANDNASLLERLDNIQSQEIVIAFAGPIGSQIQETVQQAEMRLHQNGYTVHRVKISDLIIDLFENLPPAVLNSFQPTHPLSLDEIKTKKDPYKRIYTLQEMGNHLRQNYEENILAQAAIKDITLIRMKSAQEAYDKYVEDWKEQEPGPQTLAEYSVSTFRPPKTAYLIDQLKHPSEADLLRRVYSDLFYLVGIIENRGERIKHIETLIRSHNPNDAPTKAQDLENRDKSQEEKHGQQLEKTLQFADYFIYRPKLNITSILEQLSRFFSLLHADSIRTPTSDEFGMYTAFSASLGSACLSRQVGACIVSETGEILSTGRNDVPKFNGGLYSSDSDEDNRCYNNGEGCHNDKHKNII